MGCSWGARFHAKERRYFCVLFRERFRCDGNLKRDRSTFRAKVAKTAMAWPKLGFGWYWPLRTSAAGLEGPRGIFLRQDAPKKPFKYTLERRYSARAAGKLRARRARRGATRYSHSAETRLWRHNRGARSHAKARRGICALFRERSGRGGTGSSMRGCFAFGANAPNAGIAWPKPGFGWCWPLPPPRLAWGAPGAYFDGKIHQKNLLTVPWEGVVILGSLYSAQEPYSLYNSTGAPYSVKHVRL